MRIIFHLQSPLKYQDLEHFQTFQKLPLKKNKLLTADIHNGMAKRSVILKLHLHNEFPSLPNYIPQKEKNKLWLKDTARLYWFI